MSDAARRFVIARHLPGWYRQFARPARRVLAEQEQFLRNFLEDVGMRGIHAVSTRVKPEQSVRDALLEGRYESLYDFPDIAGLRVVVFSLGDVEIVAQCFLRQAGAGTGVELLEDLEKDKDGYRARHLRLKVEGSYLRSGMPVRMEVQIRTLSQDLFDTLSRTYSYKNPNASWDAGVRDALATRMREAEELVSTLQAAADGVNATNPSDSMSPDSFVRIVREVFQEDVSIARAVSAVIYHRDYAVQTNGDLRKLLEENIPRAEELVRLEAALPEEERIFSRSPRHSVTLMAAHGGHDFLRHVVEDKIARRQSEGG